jgi:hypothetical protein
MRVAMWLGLDRLEGECAAMGLGLARCSPMHEGGCAPMGYGSLGGRAAME